MLLLRPNRRQPARDRLWTFYKEYGDLTPAERWVLQAPAHNRGWGRIRPDLLEYADIEAALKDDVALMQELCDKHLKEDVWPEEWALERSAPYTGPNLSDEDADAILATQAMMALGGMVSSKDNPLHPKH